MIPKNITKDNIITAIKDIVALGNEIPPSRQSYRYDLVYEGRRFPPKHIISLASKYPNSIELSPDKFNSIEAKDYLTKLGFDIDVRNDKNKPQIWIEKTIAANRPDRLSGDYAVGTALWSPTASQSGGDIYKNMRTCNKGDIVLHLVDNEAIIGVSIVRVSYEERDINIGTPWDGKCYVVQVGDYYLFENPINREAIFSEENKEKLIQIIGKQGPVFYTRTFELRQGAYLTPCGSELLSLLNNIYKESGMTP